MHEFLQGLDLPFPLHQVCGHFQQAFAGDLVHEFLQSLEFPFPLHQVCGHFEQAAAEDLVHESPQGLDLPFPLHQIPGHFQSAAAAGKITLNHCVYDFCSKRKYNQSIDISNRV